jgi:hypothetical protein
MLVPLKSTSKELMHMNWMRRGVLASMVVGSMAGGAVGATVLSAASSSAATTTPATTTATAPQGAPPAGGQVPGGVFHPNENATHEKTESAQREAQETAGKFPTVP